MIQLDIHDLRNFFEYTSDFFAAIDGAQLVACNDLAKLTFALDPETGGDLLSVVHPADRADVVARLADAEQGAQVQFEARCVRADGAIRWIHWTARSSPGTSRTYLSGRDVTDEHLLHDQLQRRAALLEQTRRKLEHALRAQIRESHTDPLTGLLNRRAFELRAAEELSRSQRLGTPFALALLDVDRFGAINKRYGHVVGDAALSDLARRLNLSRRRHEVVGRWGGDEFVVLFPGAAPEVARLATERLCAAVSACPVQIGAQQLALSVSAGVAAGAGLAIPELIEMADRALLRAKRTGRGRVVTQAETCPPAAGDAPPDVHEASIGPRTSESGVPLGRGTWEQASARVARSATSEARESRRRARSLRRRPQTAAK